MAAKAARKPGRPPIPVGDVAALQELYLDLLRLGKTEIEINAVEGMVSWNTRYHWLADEAFSTRRLAAQRQGVEFALVAHDERMTKVYDMALEEAANKPLVDIVKEMGAHTRWRASKLAREVYGDKTETTVKGDADAPILHTFTLKIDNS